MRGGRRGTAGRAGGGWRTGAAASISEEAELSALRPGTAPQPSLRVPVLRWGGHLEGAGVTGPWRGGVLREEAVGGLPPPRDGWELPGKRGRTPPGAGRARPPVPGPDHVLEKTGRWSAAGRVWLRVGRRLIPRIIKRF